MLPNSRVRHGLRRTPCSAFAIRLGFVLALAATPLAAPPALASIDGAAHRAAMETMNSKETLHSAVAAVNDGAEEQIHVAMLEIGPILYDLMTGDEAGMPPAWRGYVLKSAAWLALFVLLVTASAAAREWHVQRRRQAWRHRTEGLYD